jgi:hypothetical protein
MKHSRQNDFQMKSYQHSVIPMENLSASNHITHTFDQYLQKFNFHSEFDEPYDFCCGFLRFRLMLLIRKHKSPLLTCRVKANQSEHHESESLFCKPIVFNIFRISKITLVQKERSIIPFLVIKTQKQQSLLIIHASIDTTIEKKACIQYCWHKKRFSTSFLHLTLDSEGKYVKTGEICKAGTFATHKKCSQSVKLIKTHTYSAATTTLYNIIVYILMTRDKTTGEVTTTVSCRCGYERRKKQHVTQ